jgi:NADPH:quinone reductase-like Zn-dependent oxidoreductase
VKAVCIHGFGGLDVLKVEDVGRPEPGPGEALIRTQAIGVNPVDWKTCAGRGVANMIQLAFPFVPGWDISGVVEAVGPGVSRFAPGDAVFGLVRFPQPGSAYAEYVAAPVDHLAVKPHSLDHLQAAALPCVALTAWQALVECARLQPGQKVLIHAAAGGVGHVALQLARQLGAFVIGTASRRNADFVIEYGADQFVDYQAARFEACVAGVDVVLDPIAGDTRDRSWQIIKPGGMLVAIQGPASVEAAVRHGVRAEHLLVRPHAAQLAALAGLVDDGRLRPCVSAVFSLEQAQTALEFIRAGHTRGKIVLNVH